jgi:hypothetical protein
MRQEIALAEMVRAGVRFEVEEAVAVAQEIMASSRDGQTDELQRDPPSLNNVSIDRNGSVVCHACAMPPSVHQVGRLLHTMLPPDGPTRVPGALCYAIARALSEVVAPPFASIVEFAEALRRFEKVDRPTVVRQLFARAVPDDRQPVAISAARSWRERRTHGSSVAELRRQLREADQERYLLRLGQQRQAATVAPEPVLRSLEEPTDIVGNWVIERAGDPIGRRVDRHRGGRRAAAAAVAVTLAFGIGYAGVSHVGWEWVSSVLMSLLQMLRQS